MACVSVSKRDAFFTRVSLIMAYRVLMGNHGCRGARRERGEKSVLRWRYHDRRRRVILAAAADADRARKPGVTTTLTRGLYCAPLSALSSRWRCRVANHWTASN